MSKLTVNKAKKFILKNKPLFIGLVIGLVLAVTLGVYVGAQIDKTSLKSVNDSLQSGGNTNTKDIQPGQTDTVNDAQINSNSESTENQTSSGTTSKPYVAPVCTTTVVPYTTSSKISSYLGSTEYSTNKGDYNGSVKSCSADSNGYKPADITLPAGNLIIFVGTGGVTSTTQPRTSPPEPDQLDRIKADCSVQLSGHGNQEAYQLCVNTLAKYFNVSL